ncbi:hypothetical protein LTS07_004471 [Exophiala sideris]|uniref:GPI anchored protein n=1 Tax=Exophiala sideris TaxID=1016849 RepID=A0ABR0JD89_9EURO|nr:hypothetical protein LTS07_004471 [Exophiala sideris]KAK5040779.1 hypothetical protein LTR13_003080 [Exophiala sideris]KAK5061885.1 hypothetical protein LTR69_005069 [Exophiala sideris]KAK5184585.1 hypothetical protein LTR44_003260 [Eurotiomycetes sp. CCFEE 6388]
MAPWLRLAALPSSLLLFMGSLPSPVTCQQAHGLYNLPPDAKYYPEDEVRFKRSIDIQQRLQHTPVAGVRKMSDDPGQKFHLEFWGFEPEENEMDKYSSWTNASLYTSFDHPARVLSHHQERRYLRLPGWHLFEKRDFQCPAGTSACTSIDRPNSCCSTGSTCQIVTDTGLGDVGCCPSGQVCAGSLSTCGSGYTSCPNNPGGGCCIPGYACYDVGCVQTSTATVSTLLSASTTTVTSYTTITPSVSSITTTSTSTTTTTSTTSTQSASTLSPQVLTVTRTVTVTSTPNVLTCSTGYQSCPASLGGGCCPTDRLCGSANCPASPTSSSATAAPPVRPTTLTTIEETTTTTLPVSSAATAPSTSPTTTTTSSSTSVSGCPTGFYACSAYYQGGCCQTGRNCDTTSCPASASTTVVSTDGVTVVAPTGSGITGLSTALTGACAIGWSTCAAALGGGCCPSGYQCGVTSCAATASGGAGTGKEAPSSATRTLHMDGLVLALALLASLVMCIILSL